jgi:hypothetical protein
LNRRRFLKYAGATAAVVGASALGLDDLVTRQQFISTARSTASLSFSSSTSASSERLISTASFTANGFGNVWESHFGSGNLSDFDLGVDASVGCKNFAPEISDIDRRIAGDSTDPAHTGKVLELVANVNKRPGVFVNAITGRYGDFFDEAHYYAYGYFRKLPSDFQVMGVNLQLVQNYTEYVCLFYWRLNEYDELYRWIVVRTSDGDVPVHLLGDDLKWHYFEIEGHYPAQGDRKITRLRIDESTHSLDFHMLTGSKPWNQSFGVLLETTNQWANCNPKRAVQAISHWSKVGLVRES